MENMNFLYKLLIIAPTACLLAQTPPAPAPTPTPAAPPAVAPAAPKLATPVPPGLLTPPPAPPKPVQVPPDRVVLKAGSVTLTAAQFDEIIKGLPERFQAMYRGPGRKQFADTLVQLYILSDEGRRRKLDETHAYKVQSTLNDDNVLASMIRDQVVAEAKVDEADARKYYDEHKDTYEQVTARHILIRAKGSPRPVKSGAKELSDEEALAKANDLHKRILAGEDFATLAKAESDDPGSADNGGLLPAFPRGQNVPSFDQVAFKLKPGEVSEPVKSQFGYHIIKVEAHTTKTFEEVRPQIEKLPVLVQARVKKALDDMTKGAFYDPEFFGPPQPAVPPQVRFTGPPSTNPPAAPSVNPPATTPAPPATPPAPVKP
jgi:peptidyl-prolyl cis-trans isomerase C